MNPRFPEVVVNDRLPEDVVMLVPTPRPGETIAELTDRCVVVRIAADMVEDLED